MGAHPFTTIDPNVGEAFFTVSHPEALDATSPILSTAEPSFGFAGDGRRRIPVVVKDVAGLVGATRCHAAQSCLEPVRPKR